MTPRRVLFLCSRHRLRSPTAAAVFGDRPGLEVDSAGLADDAETPLDPAQLDWADLVVVMEAHHARRLRERFGSRLRHTRVVSVDIPDRYAFMQPELVALLERRVGPLLR
ncbi:MAG TPA: phosphotyrosine protein phosphatase [Dyella sp.]|nr:phosphotyrosine protein phosphatase [Dyella sp.]